MATKETVHYIRIILINIKRNLIAMLELGEYCTKRKINIAIQEPIVDQYAKLLSLSVANTSIFHIKDFK
jgi:hypothetical protein